MAHPANTTIRTERSFDELIDDAISRNGFAVVPVGYGDASAPGGGDPAADHPWSYSVGLSAVGLPELVLLGLDPLAAHFAMCWVATEAMSGRPVAADQRLDVAGIGIKVVEVPEEWLLTDPSRMAAWFDHARRHGRAVGLPRLRQVVWADAEGRFPDDPTIRPGVDQPQVVLRDDPVSVPHRSHRTARRARRVGQVA